MPPLKIRGSKISFYIERDIKRQAAEFTGVVNESNTPLPGVTITLRHESTKRETTRVTDPNGVFRITAIDDGVYRVDVRLAGFTTASLNLSS